ncbi:hypothetical protein [Alicyclobacillus macrosporangiidus]|uniref:N-acetyltransferase domain-containing protein n=1 Tax=Alicyclobacillus macrosporangiidus TaxID=392015 RepID=A0A1I7L3T3_9BACL|nr:hypothetical protein [Alicyclobacillus macrosporangiidus]SFV04298.1 hypothetical protein SAMN05421543_12425 [Alicyclobacillus macrosporangiidus]
MQTLNRLCPSLAPAKQAGGHPPCPGRRSLPLPQAAWVDARKAKSLLSNVLNAWHQDTGGAYAEAAAIPSLAAIRHQFWLADCGHHPPPMLAAAIWPDGRTAGLLAGWPRHALRDFFITGVALHPSLDPASSEGLRTAETLLECAMDASLGAGCGGWLACLAGPDDAWWEALGFSPDDPFTLRRLGYFQRSPLQ